VFFHMVISIACLLPWMKDLGYGIFPQLDDYYQKGNFELSMWKRARWG